MWGAIKAFFGGVKLFTWAAVCFFFLATTTWIVNLALDSTAKEKIRELILGRSLETECASRWQLFSNTTNANRLEEILSDCENSTINSIVTRRLRYAMNWDKLKYSNDRASIKEFVDSIDDNAFSALANSRLKDLLEVEDWTHAQVAADPEPFRDYIANHHGEKHERDANDRLIQLEVVAWDSALELNSVVSYAEFNRTWPDSKHLSESKNRMELLEDNLSWQGASKLNVIDAFRNYLSDHMKGQHRHEAQLRIEQIDDDAWSVSLTQNTEESFSHYLLLLPLGRHATEAKVRHSDAKDEAEWRRAESVDSADGFRQYRIEHPEGRYRQKADDSLDRIDDAAWAMASSQGGADEANKYLQAWPKGRHESSARDRLTALADEDAWRQAVARGSIDSFAFYLANWPMGHHVEAAVSDRNRLKEEQDWQVASATTKKGACRLYIDNWPFGKHKEEALTCLDRFQKSAWASASQSDTIDSIETYIDEWPNGQNATRARQRLAELKVIHEPNRCDSLAANPDDSEKVADGVSYQNIDFLEAIAECQQASKDNPKIMRFRYQLARAYQASVTPEPAVPLLKSLVEQRYAAAYDNLGWLYARGRGVNKDMSRALELFNKGALLGSSDAMCSIGFAFAHSHDFDKAEYWYKKAKDNGNGNADEYLNALERQRSASEENQQSSQVEQPQIPEEMKQLPLKIFQSILQRALQQN